MSDTTKDTKNNKVADKKPTVKTNTKLDKLVDLAKSQKETKTQLSFKFNNKLVETMKQVSAEKEVNLTAIVEAILNDAFGVK